jgi:hypothetical protein
MCFHNIVLWKYRINEIRYRFFYNIVVWNFIHSVLKCVVFFLYKVSVYNCINYKIYSDRIKRYQGQHVVQAWNDEQVDVYDYMSRLWTYRYVGVFDKDEFIVPELQNPIQGALKSLLERHRWSKLISLRSDLLDCYFAMSHTIIEKNFKQCWSKIQLISTKPTTTSKLNARTNTWVNTLIMCNVLLFKKCVSVVMNHSYFQFQYLITHLGWHHYVICYGRPCFTGGFKNGRSYFRDGL